MRILLLLLFFLIKNGVPAFASPDYDKLWQQANKFYEQKIYDSAAFYYEGIASGKPEDADVYYNLGNTYYRLNLIGPAVLNYERALRIDPDYKDAKDNLLLTQNRIGNRIQSAPEIFFVKWWKAWTHGSRAGMWAVLSLILFLALIGAILARRFNKVQFPPQVTIALVFLYFITLVLAFFSASHKKDSGRGVVMKQDTPLVAAPQSTKSQSLVPEGTTVKWGSENGGMVEVTLPDGRSGWMSKAALEKI